MSKYKLIKEYPGSLPKDTVVEAIEGTYPKMYKTINEGIWINGHRVEDHPEFWEKVEEKDYEILTYESSTGCIGNVKISNDFKIRSIKRLSDDEVFTVGDAVVHKSLGNAGQIHKFYILSNGIWFKTSGFDVPMGLVSDKVKVSLFRTEDGVDVFEGDVVYVVDERFCVTSFTLKKDYVDYSSDFKLLQFSSSKIADKYIEDNEPKYSNDDLLSLITGFKMILEKDLPMKYKMKLNTYPKDYLSYWKAEIKNKYNE